MAISSKDISVARIDWSHDGCFILSKLKGTRKDLGVEAVVVDDIGCLRGKSYGEGTVDNAVELELSDVAGRSGVVQKADVAVGAVSVLL